MQRLDEGGGILCVVRTASKVCRGQARRWCTCQSSSAFHAMGSFRSRELPTWTQVVRAQRSAGRWVAAAAGAAGAGGDWTGTASSKNCSRCRWRGRSEGAGRGTAADRPAVASSGKGAKGSQRLGHGEDTLEAETGGAGGPSGGRPGGLGGGGGTSARAEGSHRENPGAVAARLGAQVTFCAAAGAGVLLGRRPAAAAAAPAGPVLQTAG